jgi:GntR family transcriptional repressor for pyruvate dehydrogenase complex
VREALKSLELLGLVEVRQGDGTYLKRSESELLPQIIEWGLLLGAKRTRDLVEARHHLEVILAGLAAERRSDEDIVRLNGHVDDMRGAGRDVERFVEADIAFHVQVAATARNQTLEQIMVNVRSLLKVWISRVMLAAHDFEPSLSEHVAVLDAVVAGDVEASREAMERHMVGATQRLEATLLADSENGVPAL